jgi:hypothetical protein
MWGIPRWEDQQWQLTINRVARRALVKAAPSSTAPTVPHPLRGGQGNDLTAPPPSTWSGRGTKPFCQHGRLARFANCRADRRRPSQRVQIWKASARDRADRL